MRTILARTTMGGFAIVGGMLGLTLVGCEDGGKGAEVETGQQTESLEITQACDVFTLEMAQQVLGAGAKRSETATPFAGSTDDLAGSTCTYEAEDPTPVNRFVTTITASVLLTGARTDTGRSSNRWTFEQGRTDFQQAGAETESVAGVGDAAYYIGGITNQLHVLLKDGGYHLIVSANDPDGNDPAATEELAKMITNQL